MCGRGNEGKQWSSRWSRTGRDMRPPKKQLSAVRPTVSCYRLPMNWQQSTAMPRCKGERECGSCHLRKYPRGGNFRNQKLGGGSPEGGRRFDLGSATPDGADDLKKSRMPLGVDWCGQVD